MAYFSETLGLPVTAFTLLRDLIHEHTGMFYDETKRELLGDKLASLVISRGFDNFLDYYYVLKYDAQAADEWKKVMNNLSVQETYFFREDDQLRSLVDVVVPQHLKERPGEPLRIWSAACATGEEPLSIAMLLEEGGWFDRLPIEIYASDASTQALEKARRGLYRERSFRNAPVYLTQKYFDREEGGWQVHAGVHSKVRWFLANVAEENEVVGLAGAHVIFCRNMFIYFSEATIRKTVQIFARYMPMPGYLFVGASESLLKITNEFTLQQLAGAFVYVKNG